MRKEHDKQRPLRIHAYISVIFKRHVHVKHVNRKPAWRKCCYDDDEHAYYAAFWHLNSVSVNAVDVTWKGSEPQFSTNKNVQYCQKWEREGV